MGSRGGIRQTCAAVWVPFGAETSLELFELKSGWIGAFFGRLLAPICPRWGIPASGKAAGVWWQRELREEGRVHVIIYYLKKSHQ